MCSDTSATKKKYDIEGIVRLQRLYNNINAVNWMQYEMALIGQPK